jgi:hypothetical protein
MIDIYILSLYTLIDLKTACSVDNKPFWDEHQTAVQ